MYMKLKDGKSKVLTLSYDDGVVQDIRLISILDKYGIKGTFNINSAMYLPEDAVREKYYGRMKLSEAQKLYVDSGHEVAAHGLNHPFLEQLKSPDVVCEIMEDRRNLERDFNTVVRGMAYPYGTYNDNVVDILAQCGICYSRTTQATEKFDFPENWLTLHPTCHHNHPRLMEFAEKFVGSNLSKFSNANFMFYVWGHTYEFDNLDNWDVIEKFAEFIGGRDDIWYATNIEIYDYIKAYENLFTSADGKTVCNPNCVDVWFVHNKITYCVKAGETLRI